MTKKDLTSPFLFCPGVFELPGRKVKFFHTNILPCFCQVVKGQIFVYYTLTHQSGKVSNFDQCQILINVKFRGNSPWRQIFTFVKF